MDPKEKSGNSLAPSTEHWGQGLYETGRKQDEMKRQKEKRKRQGIGLKK